MPASFAEIYATPTGRLSVSRAELQERYELCEDRSGRLTGKGAERLHRLGVTEADVVDRILRGLQGEGSPVLPHEGRWVVRRLSELLGWDDPGPGEEA